MAVPYGYSLVETAEGLGTLYETPYAMPIGYTYDSLITEEAWNRLSAIEKQQALMLFPPTLRRNGAVPPLTAQCHSRRCAGTFPNLACFQTAKNLKLPNSPFLLPENLF